MRPLTGTRVLDASSSLAGQLCGAILARSGAAVVRRGLPGDPSLGGHADGREWQAFLDLDKQVLDADGADADVYHDLLLEMDVLVTSAPAARLADLGLDDEALRREHPDLLAVSVTPFGLDGPYAALAGDDLVLAALSGLADATPGFPDRRERFADPPLQSRAPLAEVGNGIVAAVAVLGAIVGRRRGRHGPRVVEVAGLEAVAAQMVFEWGICAFGGGVRGRRPVPADLEPNCYLPCRDGHVVLVAFSDGHWRGLVEMMGTPDWAAAPEFADGATRARHAAELHARLRAWTETRSGDDILREAQARGLPCCWGLELSETVRSEQVVGNKGLRQASGRTYPADPVVVNGRRREPVRSGAQPAAVSARRADHAEDGDGAHPLAGLRVLDLSQVVAGPYCGMLLASLGADVVVVESPTRLLSRGFAPFIGEPWWDGSMMFNNVNRGKRSIALDLRTAEGRGVLESLVRSADVVLENFSLRAARSLRLTYEDLRAVRADVVLASISAFGRTGPWGDYVALHSGVILLSGLASVTRDEAGVPRLSGAIYPDLLAGGYMAVAVQEAVLHREETGEGCHVEVGMLDVLLNSMGGLVPAAADGDVIERDASRFLPTAEPGRFLAVPPGARVDEGEIAGLSRRVAMLRLQAAGVRVAAVQDIGEVLVDPHLTARGFLVADDHPISGPRIMAGVPWRMDGHRPELAHAPRLGEHTDDVLASLGGYEAGDAARLRDAGVLA